jgi:hypothetical protein
MMGNQSHNLLNGIELLVNMFKLVIFILTLSSMVDASEFLCKDLFVVPYIQVIDDLIKLEDSFSGISDSTTDSMSKIMLLNQFNLNMKKLGEILGPDLQKIYFDRKSLLQNNSEESGLEEKVKKNRGSKRIKVETRVFLPEKLRVLEYGEIMRAAAFSQNSQKVFIGSDNLFGISGQSSRLTLWDISTGENIMKLEERRAKIRSLEVSHNGKLLLSTSHDNVNNRSHFATLWETQTGKKLFDFASNKISVNTARFSSDDKHIVTASNDGHARTWDVESGELLYDFFESRLLHKNVNTAAYSHDNKFIVTSSQDGNAYVWNAQNGLLLFVLEGIGVDVVSAEYSSNDKFILAAGGKNVKVYDANNGKPLFDIDYRGKFIVSNALFSPDGSFIVTVSKDHIDFWVGQNGDFAFSIQNPNGNFTSATFSENSELLIITSENKTAEIWSLKKDLQFIRKQ